MSAAFGLDLTNFFLADVRDGMGPFLATFLTEKGGWDPARIGLVMTLSGLAEVVVQGPAGALVDRVRGKRWLIVAGSVAIALSCLGLLLTQEFVWVLLGQMVARAAAAVIGPALAGITLGMVGPTGMASRLGRNEAWNHAGNLTAAGGAGLLALELGIDAVFALLAAMTIGAILSVASIPASAIDPRLARGLGRETDTAPASVWQTLRDPVLLGFAVTLALFHLGNGAMLPLLGQRLALADPERATTWMSACIVVAQLTMIGVALLAGRAAERYGHRWLVVVALAVLPVRGILAAWSADPWMLLPVQVLDGVGAGILGVVVPLIVADLTFGSGRFNTALGAVMTVQHLGGALSGVFGGTLAASQGWATAFLLLGVPPLVALGVFVATGRTRRAATA